MNVVLLFFFFFKQKTAYEILGVTGVQTCALPIYLPAHALRGLSVGRGAATLFGARPAPPRRRTPLLGGAFGRSSGALPGTARTLLHLSRDEVAGLCVLGACHVPAQRAHLRPYRAATRRYREGAI